MTIGGALSELNNLLKANDIPFYYKPSIKAVIDTIELLSNKDYISRQQAINKMQELEDEDIKAYGCEIPEGFDGKRAIESLKALSPSIQPKIGQCKDCKHWKDSDGVYRRGIGAESQCPINGKKVFEGNGYCYMFEPKENEVIK